MAFKDFCSKTFGWLKTHKPSQATDYQMQIDEEGLISQDDESEQSAGQETTDQGSKVMVKMVKPKDKTQTLEKLQAGFDRLIEQLQGINEHLNYQVARHEDLMNQINKLPKLLESFPAVVETQKQLTQQLLEQLQAAAAKQQQFVDAVEKIPNETAKQTDALVEIDHQLAAAADTDVQMAESFNKFNETVDKLNQTAMGQTDAISQMSRTFATSDRYLKYIISRQNKRFMWVFVTAIGVCVLVILILVGIILYLRQ
jgi:chromosome segregation ATPase